MKAFSSSGVKGVICRRVRSGAALELLLAGALREAEESLVSACVTDIAEVSRDAMSHHQLAERRLLEHSPGVLAQKASFSGSLCSATLRREWRAEEVCERRARQNIASSVLAFWAVPHIAPRQAVAGYAADRAQAIAARIISNGCFHPSRLQACISALCTMFGRKYALLILLALIALLSTALAACTPPLSPSAVNLCAR